MDSFIVSVDPKGELAFSSHAIEKKGRPASHVIEVLTEQALPEYLAYLKKLGISYVFAGVDRLDCTLLLKKLYSLFGIEKLMVAGGGVMNWSFLVQGCIEPSNCSSSRWQYYGSVYFRTVRIFTLQQPDSIVLEANETSG